MPINQFQSETLREPITHETGARPFSIHYTQVASGTKQLLYLHWHTEAEFYFLEKGEVILSAGDQTFHLFAGDTILIPPFVLHSAVSIGSAACSHYAFVFSPSLLADSTRDTEYYTYLSIFEGTGVSKCILIRPNHPWEKQILSHLQHIFSYYDHDFTSCSLSIHGYFLLICQELVNHYATPNHSINYRNLSQQLKPVLFYMNENYSADLSLEQLASCVYLSREQFCRSFKKLTGLTPFTYLIRLRILKSCELLLSDHKKIADIASLCGFSNISYFNREFKRFMHMNPKAYRTHHK